MITMRNMVAEKTKKLHLKSNLVKFPLSKSDKALARSMHEFIVNSQNPEINQKYNLREAVGLASPQIGIYKQMFAVYFMDIDKPDKYSFVAFNPEIIKRSDEIIYLPGGEGCLSVNRETSGLTPRNKSITARFIKWDLINEPVEVEEYFEGYPAIVFQHEFNHLQGKLFCDDLVDSEDGMQPAFDVNQEK